MGALTHGEFLDLYDGWVWRTKQQRQNMAQLASWVTAPHVKRPIDPKKFLQEKTEKKKTTPEKTAAIISDLEKMVGVS